MNCPLDREVYEYIITHNTKDFKCALELKVKAITPAEFLTLLSSHSYAVIPHLVHAADCSWTNECECMAPPCIGTWMNRVTGVILIGFGLRLGASDISLE